MNLHEYEINWNKYSSFSKRGYLENYFFLMTALIHLEQKTFSEVVDGKQYFNLDDKILYKYGPLHDEYEDEPYTRIINLSIAYLEKYCLYEDILMDLRRHYNGLTYQEYINSDPNSQKDRLLSIIKNNVLEKRFDRSLVDPKSFHDRLPSIDIESVDSFLGIKERLPTILKTLQKLKDQPYCKLISLFNQNRKKHVNNLKAELRLLINRDFSADEGISFDSFLGTHRQLSPLNLTFAPSVKFLESSFPRTPQLIAVFHFDNFHSLIKAIVSANIKLGFLYELDKKFSTEDSYTPPIFKVDGAAQAVLRYGEWFIERYEILYPGALGRKIVSQCYIENLDGTLHKLKYDSVMQEIRRKIQFLK